MALRRVHVISVAMAICVAAGTVGVPNQTSKASELPRPQLRPLRQVDSPDAITYVYDPVGRLRAVVDPASSAAQYTYDVVGNITAISTFSSTQTSLIEWTPTTGA